MKYKPMDIEQNTIMNDFVKTDDILKDMCGIIESSQKAAYQAVNTALIRRNWLLGYRIASEEMQGEERAKYGAEIIKRLAKDLSAEYGKGIIVYSRRRKEEELRAEIEIQKAMFYLQQSEKKE